jgi:hypothetical protein
MLFTLVNQTGLETIEHRGHKAYETLRAAIEKKI